MIEQFESASDFYNSVTYTETIMLYILALCRLYKDKLVDVRKVKENASTRYILTFETKQGRAFESSVFVKSSPSYPGGGGPDTWLDNALAQYTGIATHN